MRIKAGKGTCQDMNVQNLSSQQKTSMGNTIDFTCRQKLCCNKVTERIIYKERRRKELVKDEVGRQIEWIR